MKNNKLRKLQIALIGLVASTITLFTSSSPPIDVNIFFNSNGNSVLEIQPSSPPSQVPEISKR